MQLPPLNLEAIPSLRHSVWLRMVLGHRVLNGLSVGVGLGLLSVALYLAIGPERAASASVGMLILSIGDQVSPARGKLRQLAPLLWMAGPMSLAVQLAHLLPDHESALVGVLVCIGGFIGMLGTAWGARGGSHRLRLAAGRDLRDVDAAARGLARGVHPCAVVRGRGPALFRVGRVQFAPAQPAVPDPGAGRRPERIGRHVAAARRTPGRHRRPAREPVAHLVDRTGPLGGQTANRARPGPGRSCERARTAPGRHPDRRHPDARTGPRLRTRARHAARTRSSANDRAAGARPRTAMGRPRCPPRPRLLGPLHRRQAAAQPGRRAASPHRGAAGTDPRDAARHGGRHVRRNAGAVAPGRTRHRGGVAAWTLPSRRATGRVSGLRCAGRSRR